jgi:hypothetical protein
LLCEALHSERSWQAYAPKSGLHIYRIKKSCQGFLLHYPRPQRLLKALQNNEFTSAAPLRKGRRLQGAPPSRRRLAGFNWEKPRRTVFLRCSRRFPAGAVLGKTRA